MAMRHGRWNVVHDAIHWSAPGIPVRIDLDEVFEGV